jgi:hypothetical protein
MLNVKPIAQTGIATFRQRFIDAFFRDEWIDRVYQQRLRYFGIYDNTNLVGGFVVYEGGRGPLKTLITPPFYPHIGLFVNDPKITMVQLFECLYQFARSQYVCYVKLDLPLRYFSPSTTPIWSDRWTYQLTLNDAKELLWEGIHPSIKSSYNKSIKEQVVFQPLDDKALALQWILVNFDEKQVKIKQQVLENLHRFLVDHPTTQYWGSYKAGKLIALNIIYIDAGIAYHLFSAFDRKANLNYANAAHLMATLLHLHDHFPHVHTFDFEGSTVPTIDFYFKRFGGRQIKYSSLFYTKLPAIFKANA